MLRPEDLRLVRERNPELVPVNASLRAMIEGQLEAEVLERKVMKKMGRWLSRVSIKHLLLTEEEDWESIQKSMNAIADVLDITPEFMSFNHRYLGFFRNIPTGDEIIRPVDYANKLIDAMYDYADDHRIWVE